MQQQQAQQAIAAAAQQNPTMATAAAYQLQAKNGVATAVATAGGGGDRNQRMQMKQNGQMKQMKQTIKQTTTTTAGQATLQHQAVKKNEGNKRKAVATRVSFYRRVKKTSFICCTRLYYLRVLASRNGNVGSYVSGGDVWLASAQKVDGNITNRFK
jgi:hypothetical protein